MDTIEQVAKQYVCADILCGKTATPLDGYGFVVRTDLDDPLFFCSESCYQRWLIAKS